MKSWHQTELFATTTDGRYRRMVIEEGNLRSGTLSFPPGSGAGTHAHPRSDEIFFIVGGAGAVVVEGESVEVRPGDLVYVAPGEQHKIVVDDTSAEPLVLFAVVAPNFGNDAVFATEPNSGPTPSQ